jgi:hypothetical protein
MRYKSSASARHHWSHASRVFRFAAKSALFRAFITGIGIVPLSLETSVFPTRSCLLSALEQQVAQHSGIGMLRIACSEHQGHRSLPRQISQFRQSCLPRLRG